MTKGAYSKLPGWQPKEDLNCQAGYDCLDNAKVETRREAVGWAPLVWQDRWLPPFGDCGSVVSCHWAMMERAEGGDPKTDQVKKVG